MELPDPYLMTRRSEAWAKPRGSIDTTHESRVFPPDGFWEIPTLEPERCWPVRMFGYQGRFRKVAQPGDYIHFYTHDYRFELLWKKPGQVLPVLAKVGSMLTPDFSVHWEAPRAVHLYNVYRNRWIGCYAQAHQIKVIPTVTWCDWPSLDYCLTGLPRNGLVAVSSQSARSNPDNLKLLHDGLRELVQRVQPAGLVIYGQTAPLPDLGVEVRRYETHMDQVRQEIRSGEGE